MKETINVNIASVAFVLDQDAYRILNGYLNEIRRRLPEEDKETLSDIEARLAEIFRERVTSPMRVITLEVVRNAMKQMGSPSDFGMPLNKDAGEQSSDIEEPRRIYRSRTDRSIGGVCGGLAAYFDTDATLLRVVTLLLIFLGGLSLWVYIILWIIIPKTPLLTNNNKNTKTE